MNTLVVGAKGEITGQPGKLVLSGQMDQAFLLGNPPVNLTMGSVPDCKSPLRVATVWDDLSLSERVLSPVLEDPSVEWVVSEGPWAEEDTREYLETVRGWGSPTVQTLSYDEAALAPLQKAFCLKPHPPSLC